MSKGNYLAKCPVVLQPELQHARTLSIYNGIFCMKYNDSSYILRLRKDILGLLRFLKLKYLCGFYRGRELRGSTKGKGEFLIPQEMCGGLHTYTASP